MILEKHPRLGKEAYLGLEISQSSSLSLSLSNHLYLHSYALYKKGRERRHVRVLTNGNENGVRIEH